MAHNNTFIDINLFKIRHSLAHVLAQAVKKLYPNAKLGFGPPIDTGFYYDFDFGNEKIEEDKLKELQKLMCQIIQEKQKFESISLNVQEATNKLKELNEVYKIEHIVNLSQKGIKEFSFYKNGDFIDLCEGPHVNHTGELPIDGFKLDRIAGAYWLGDEKNKMLTRIYGLAFSSKVELDEFLKKRQIAQQFDHKKLGKELDLYSQQDIVGPGLILWHPNGTVIREEIEKLVKEKEFLYGYKRVYTPHITKSDLFLKSGHLQTYKSSMFPPMRVDEDADGTIQDYYLKPMNCPFHHLIYSSKKRSYRELPLRLAEYGTNYRYEKSGELTGLLRVRCMCMNDAHIYLAPSQFKDEFKKLMQMYKELYDIFKLQNYTFRLSTRGTENKEKFIGDNKLWEQSEQQLSRVLDELNIKYYIGEGEAAFYGPKVDIQFKNLMGREETVSTIQVDYLAATKFNLNYIDEDGKEKPVLVIHRAPLSTHERFISYLIEYYGGAFPVWCAPIQVCIIPIQESLYEYADKLADILFKNFIRVEVDKSANTLNKKIRNNTIRKIPILLIVGEKEKNNYDVTIRRYGIKEQQTISFNIFLDELKEEISQRRMDKTPMNSII